MSTTQLSRVLEEFISDESNDLLLLKGSWGVGKTYFWRNAITQASQHNHIGKPSYSYVSLFGLNDLQELKNAIFAAKTDAKSIHIHKNTKEIVSNLKEMIKPIGQITAVREWTGGLADTALFLLVRDTIICFDDIERKGDGLNARDLLGLASLLKDQRNCKIIFILNDDSLSPEELNQFRKHSEKLVDIELEFAPTPSEAFDYIFPAEYAYREYISQYCSKLGIRNIRAIQRIERFARKLIASMSGSDEQVIQKALQSLVLYVWCFYDKESNAPDFQYLKNFSLYVSLFRKENGAVGDDIKKWNEILKFYEYRATDELDLCIMSLVEMGYLNTSAFNEELIKKNHQSRMQQGQDTLQKIWQL